MQGKQISPNNLVLIRNFGHFCKDKFSRTHKLQMNVLYYRTNFCNLYYAQKLDSVGRSIDVLLREMHGVHGCENFFLQNFGPRNLISQSKRILGFSSSLHNL